MRYMGGKARQAKYVKEVIEKYKGDRTRYVEPFVGGGSVLAKVAPLFKTVEASDIVPELIDMWKALQNGWIPPDKMTKEEWESLREQDYSSALKGFAAFGVSYRGKYFAGYQKDFPGHATVAYSKNSTIKKSETMKEVQFYTRDYREISVDSNTVVYCDPPYQGTALYNNKIFSHRSFWRVMEQWNSTGALVVVHECNAPDGWIKVFSKDRNVTIDFSNPYNSLSESIYLHKDMV